jgi:ubiquitin carboxyl-terminal hydrolase L5
MRLGNATSVPLMQDEWLERAAEVINERIAAYAAQEIRFNLMAIVEDRRLNPKARLKELDQELQAAELEESARRALIRERYEVEERLEMFAQERKRWHAENLRRKHNYIPLIFNFLQILAERDELAPLLEQARKGPDPTVQGSDN